MRRRATSFLLLLAVCCGLAASFARGEENQDRPLKPGEFPAAGAGTYIAGELVIVDPVNRRGGLRLDGDGAGGRYYSGPLHYFAMLPFGMLWYNGAPAELRDIPLGTHVHGYLVVPPVGEEATIPPLPKDQEQFAIKHNHAISLEDDFSFYQRRGQAWKVISIDPVRGKLNVAPVGQPPQGIGAQRVIPGAGSEGAFVKDGINKPYTFDIDQVTRVWKDRKLADLDAILPDQIVQLNLVWSQGWQDKEFTVSDIWLDEVSRSFATELQRRRHVRYQRQRWLPGWIDSVEHFDFGGGIVTITLFGGMDPSLYADLKRTQDKGFGLGSSDKTLRTWFHRADKKIGEVQEWREIQDPPSGSSGIQVRLKFTELLEGYRPGRIVRVKCDEWKFVTMPPEERLKSLEEQQRSSTFSVP